MMNFGEAADGRQVFLSGAEDNLELTPRGIQLAKLDQGPAQRHAGRQIAWMNGEAGAAHLGRLGVLPGAAVLLCELRKCNRRRVFLNPASQFLNTRIVGHADRRLSNSNDLRGAGPLTEIICDGQRHRVCTSTNPIVILGRTGVEVVVGSVSPVPGIVHDTAAVTGYDPLALNATRVDVVTPVEGA